MADIRIKDLTTTASSTASDDFIAVDGTTNGTRKLNAFSPTFGGNATVTGTLTVNSTLTANGPASGITVNGAGITLDNDPVGSSASLRFVDGATPRFWIYKLSGDSNLYFRDMTNGRMQLQMLPGATSSNAISTFNSILSVTSTTASTSTSSGALVVGNGTSGGLGVGGSIYAGDNINSVNPQGKIQIQGTGNTTGVKEINLLRSDGGDACTFGLTGTSYNGVFLAGGLGNNEAFLYNAAPFRVFIGTAAINRFDFTASQFKINPTTASTTTSSGALVVSGGVGVAGNTNIGGVVSVGGSSNAAVGVYVINTALTGVDQYGVASEPIWTSAAVSGHTIWARTKTAASAFTLTNGTAIYVEQPTLGSGSSITNNYGLRITNQGAAGVANAYGVDILAQSGASSTNVGLRNAGTTLLTNSTASTSTSSGALVVSGGVGVAGAINAGGPITTGSDGSLVAIYVPGDSAIRAAAGKFYLDTRATDGGDIVLRPRITAALTLAAATGNATFGGNITTAAPSGGTAAAWKLGTVATVSPTSPNRTIEVDIGGTIYYIHAKTTNN